MSARNEQFCGIRIGNTKLYWCELYLIEFEWIQTLVLYLLYLHHCYSLREDTYLVGGTVGEVNHQTSAERTAISNLHDNTLAILDIGDLQHGAERVGAVGTRQTVVMKA